MKKILFTVLYLTLILSISFATPFAEVDITSSKLISCDPKKILGSITVTNSSELYSPELYYTTTLSVLKVVDAESMITTAEPYYEFEPVNFDLGAYEEKTLYFEYRMPNNLPQAQYALSTHIYSDTTPITTVPDIIHIGPWGTKQESLICNTSHYWKIGKDQILPDTGPTYKIGKTPVGVIELTSTFEESITAIPEFTVYKRLKTYEPTPIKVTQGKPITFEHNKTTKVELDFPTFNEPESYEIFVKFLDDDGNQVSQEFLLSV